MRLIDANVLKWKLGQVRLYVPWLCFGKTAISKILESYRRAVFEEIDNASTVDAAPVVHVRWIKVHEWRGLEVLKCSACGREHPRLPTAYCCDCGAKMDQE